MSTVQVRIGSQPHLVGRSATTSIEPLSTFQQAGIFRAPGAVFGTIGDRDVVRMPDSPSFVSFSSSVSRARKFALSVRIVTLPGVGATLPIPLSLEEGEAEVVVSSEALGIHVQGADMTEALQEFVAVFQEQLDHYNATSDDSLSDRARIMKQNFLKLAGQASGSRRLG